MLDFTKISRLSPELFQTLQNQITANVINAENIERFLPLLSQTQLNQLAAQFPEKVNGHLQLLNLLQDSTFAYVNGAKISGTVSAESVADIRERDAKLLAANPKAIFHFTSKAAHLAEINTTLQRLIELSKEKQTASIQDFNYLLSRLAVLHILRHRTSYGFISGVSYGQAKILATGSKELRKMLEHFQTAIDFDSANLVFKPCELSQLVFNTEADLLGQMQHDSEKTLERLGNAPKRIAEGKLWHIVGKSQQSAASTANDLAALLTPAPVVAVAPVAAPVTEVAKTDSESEDEFFECEDDLPEFEADNVACSSTQAPAAPEASKPKAITAFFARADISKEPTYDSNQYIQKFSDQLELVKRKLAGKELSDQAKFILATLEQNIKLLQESTKLDLDSWVQCVPKLLKLKAAGDAIDSNFKNALHIPEVEDTDSAEIAQVYADHLFRNKNLQYSEAEVKMLRKHQNKTPEDKKRENAERATALQEKIDAIFQTQNHVMRNPS